MVRGLDTTSLTGWRRILSYLHMTGNYDLINACGLVSVAFHAASNSIISTLSWTRLANDSYSLATAEHRAAATVLPQLAVAASRFANLRSVDLRGCGLAAFPGVLRSRDMVQIELSCNAIHLPDDISRFKHLAVLRVARCGLTRLPETLSMCTDLEALEIHYNPELRSLPEKLGACANLRFVGAMSCGLTTLPDSLFACTKLNALHLGGNPLVDVRNLGRIGNLKQLVTVSLAQCGLRSLPESLFECIAIRQLELDGNPLSAISAGIGRLRCLEELRVRNTQHARNASEHGITALSSALFDCTRLVALDLSGNHIGSLSPRIAKVRGEPRLPLHLKTIFSIASEPFLTI